MGSYLNFDEKDKESFMQKDIKIIVAGNKAWETSSLKKVKDELSKNDLTFIFNFTPEDEKIIIKDLLKKVTEKIFFADYTPYPFQVKNKFIFEEIFKNFIDSNEIEEQAKKRPFKMPKFQFFKRKE